MKLTIYENKQPVKTYSAETYDLMFGTVEDTMLIFKVDSLKTGSDEELMLMVVKALPTCIGAVKPLLKDIFDGLTDEELRKCKMKEIATVLVDVVKHAFEQMRIGADSKN